MKYALTFVAGMFVGAVTGAYLIKEKALADAREEINEVREYYKEKARNNKQVEEEAIKDIEEGEEELDEMKKISTDNGYTNYGDYAKQIKEEKGKSELEKFRELVDIPPYIIEPDEYGEDLEYDSTSYTYFADGVLVDDVDVVVDEPDLVVGLDNLKLFDEFGASAIYVRNEMYKMDIEILKDDWNWKDIQGNEEPEKKPHQL